MFAQWFKSKKDAKTGQFSVANKDKKVKDGIDFAIDTYGKTLKDLARYDRGEQLSH